MRANADAIAKRDFALEHTADVDEYIAPAAECAALIKARRVRKRHARLKLATRELALPQALKLGLLRAAVHAQRFKMRAGVRDLDPEAVGNRHADDVGQVVLALGVVIGQAIQPGFERRGGRGQNAGVDFFDRALRFGGVLVFDDRADLAIVIAHDAPVAGRILKNLGEHGNPLAAGVEQLFQGFGLHQWHVAIKHQGDIILAVFLEQRLGLQHRVASAELWLLQHETQLGRAGVGVLNLFRTMADDDHDLVGVQRPGAVEHMREHRAPGNGVQDLGKIGLHPLAKAGGEYDDIEHDESAW